MVGVIVLLVLGVTSFRGGTVSGDSSTEPAAFDLPALHGDDRVVLAEIRGKPVVVNFFASWCTACDFELPGFARVSEERRVSAYYLMCRTPYGLTC